VDVLEKYLRRINVPVPKSSKKSITPVPKISERSIAPVPKNSKRSIAPVPNKAREEHRPIHIVVESVIEQRNVRGCMEKGITIYSNIAFSFVL